MDKERRISTPAIPNSDSFQPHQFRSLRFDKRTVTKEPRVSVIDEQSESESTENNRKSGSSLNVENDFSDRRASVQNQSSQSKKSIKSVKSQSSIYLNRAYLNSQNNLHLHRSDSSLQGSRVVREQYWSCPKFFCRNWTKREKILVLIVASLIGLVLGLFTVIGVIVEKKQNATAVTEKTTAWHSWRL